jgi:hypothetical protein
VDRVESTRIGSTSSFGFGSPGGDNNKHGTIVGEGEMEGGQVTVGGTGRWLVGWLKKRPTALLDFPHVVV